MCFHHLVVGLMLIVAGIGAAQAAQPIAPDSMGLSKGSVFDTPSPQVYQYKGESAGQNKVLPRAYLNAPPQIPHDISNFLPITTESNMCVACHNRSDLWGKKLAQGEPTPIPKSHFTDLRNAPGKVADHLIKARFNCNQCHVPQANAQPLIENTFGSRRGR